MSRELDTDRDTEAWQYAVRLSDGRIIPVSGEQEAQAIRSGKTLRRRVGPWEEVDDGGNLVV